MKIKNQAVSQHRSKAAPKAFWVANKQNTSQNEYQPQSKHMLRSKSTFGDDITKRSNETTMSVSRKSVRKVEMNVVLPDFLKKPSGIDVLAAPYEEQILNYITSNYWQINYTSNQIKKLRKQTKRRSMVEKIYKTYKRFSLRRKALFLAVYYFDYYTARCPQRELGKLETVADACLFIAMKYEEIYPPLLSQWANGKQKQIVSMQAKILKAFDFALAMTTPQHYLEYYHAKMSTSKQERKLHELVLDLYLFTGQMYLNHPLKTVQEVLQSFRTTSFLELDTNYEESDYNVKSLITNNNQIWEYLLESEIYYKKR